MESSNLHNVCVCSLHLNHSWRKMRLVTCISAFRIFTYSWFYFDIVRSISIVSVAMIDAGAQAQWLVRAVSLAGPTVSTWNFRLRLLKSSAYYAYIVYVYFSIFRGMNFLSMAMEEAPMHTQFYWLAPLFWGQQIKVSNGVSLGTSMSMLYVSCMFQCPW